MTALRDRFRAAVAAGDVHQLKECVDEIETIQLGHRRFDPDALQLIIELLTDKSLLAMRGSGVILSSIEYDADKLSGSQRKLVVDALEQVYVRFADPMAQFQVTEVIGRKFDPKNALRLFTHLMNVEDDSARALIPHGFEHVVCKAPPNLANEAFQRLRSMLNDRAIVVVSEALLSLERIVRKRHPLSNEAERLIAERGNDGPDPVRNLAQALRRHIETYRGEEK